MVHVGKLENTPVGTIWVAASAEGVITVSLWDDEAKFLAEVTKLTGDAPYLQTGVDPILVTALTELDAYLRGALREFNSPIDWSTMTPFQRETLELVCNIPYGGTTTYGAIAQQLGKPGAVRAVGRANATNPLPIIVPCHRVLGADGKLHGYGARGGLETKAWLLRLEGSWLI